MRCLYCGKKKTKESLTSFFLEEDPLCVDCRKQMRPQRKIIEVRGMKIETFYEYDSLYKSLLIQYKECYDEALKDVFLYGILDYINLRYHGYSLALVPSSRQKREERGFDHLELMCERVRLKRVKGLRMKTELIQEGKNAEQRREMEKNYIYEGGSLGKVLLFDDVVTTGASLLGTFWAIKEKATIIKVLSLAYKSKGLQY